MDQIVLNQVPRQFTTKTRGTVTAVNDFNLTIKEGECFSFLRPSGCGNTTTLRMIAGFEDLSDSEIDLRGQTIEEGIMMVDQYIDSCLLMGIKTITIIHGKGTGALRNAIQQHLKNHKAVRSFRLGVYGEGENGVTIAELK